MLPFSYIEPLVKDRGAQLTDAELELYKECYSGLLPFEFDQDSMPLETPQLVHDDARSTIRVVRLRKNERNGFDTERWLPISKEERAAGKIKTSHNYTACAIFRYLIRDDTDDEMEKERQEMPETRVFVIRSYKKDYDLQYERVRKIELKAFETAISPAIPTLHSWAISPLCVHLCSEFEDGFNFKQLLDNGKWHEDQFDFLWMHAYAFWDAVHSILERAESGFPKYSTYYLPKMFVVQVWGRYNGLVPLEFKLHDLLPSCEHNDLDYIDPAAAEDQIAGIESDNSNEIPWSIGCVIMEIITGKKPFFSWPKENRLEALAEEHRLAREQERDYKIPAFALIPCNEEYTPILDYLPRLLDPDAGERHFESVQLSMAYDKLEPTVAKCKAHFPSLCKHDIMPIS
ncbi:hypothetical protein GUITHDRAFT_117141 [Guillardia theta CCMP2712]|uniref:Protein kinase domain-containing protein n=1 Tax=Guillardia theta (strain CCMP2712) TaxID=905079 RepID=L1IKQ3_GUITC|nr:hypothetical protein GUITHDRAFT_117141 [Guillardia theta CCMP2712]EKX36712.1 hypothetical protein GUITHDRAFT_117141 [Guillardia theta CCMP2712]|eukprot:XP_005823692.1 hypothetical protein GUITHDRAFT_117141 [Guillardia theta CCMP2712]